ncbi:MAG TPA: formylglycine-generating enzyme family protein [Planctomycetota bacterium]|nr:formylglycine-generating enzyme family protein [Planctomycetota bacterium]
MTPGALLALMLALQPREETVKVRQAGFSVPLVHVPVDGTPLRPYALGKHEVTWGEFNVFYAEGETKRVVDGLTRPSVGKSYFGQVQCPEELLEEKRPAINLRWHAGMAYCDWLTALTGRKFRLPTEAEWEHAAKSGADVDAQAWHAGNSGGTTHRPGTSKPNALGIHDLLGNVWEMCLESMAPPAYAPVYRGGAWNTPRERLSPSLRTRVTGAWYAADPQSTRSVWWLTSDFSQGMRVAAVGGPAEAAASRAYASRVPVRVTGHRPNVVPQPPEDRAVVTSKTPDAWRRVTGEVRNDGDRTIEELELQVYFLTPKGEPHTSEREGIDKPARPNYTWVHPVLVTGPEGPSKKPLAPGEARTFEVDVPETTDLDVYVDATKLGARVTWVRLAP